MEDTHSSERTSYREARSAFDKLDTQDKVAFVLEAAFTTLGRGIEVAGRTLADAMERMANEAAKAAENPPPPSENAEGAPADDNPTDDGPTA